MPGQLLDRLLVVWVFPPLGFLITISEVAELRYVVANYVLLSVIGLAIVVRLIANPPTKRLFLLLLMVLVVLGALLSIEWMHYIAGRKTIDGLSDVRMIVYSSLYGSLLIFIFLSVYLTILSDLEKRNIMRFVVLYLSYFSLFFACYWLLLYLGLVEAVPRTDHLRSNSTSYMAMFVLMLLYYFRDEISLPETRFKLFVVVNLLVIVQNRTRGAILALLIVVALEMVRRAFISRRAMLHMVMVGSLVGIGVIVSFAYTSSGVVAAILGRDADSLQLVLTELDASFEKGERIVNIAPSLVSDESSLSAFSRIGSNYYSLLSFLDSPYIGIGQGEAYSIDVLGSGVHSLHFLFANSTGLAGMLLLFTLAMILLIAQNEVLLNHRFLIISVLCFGYVLVFTNSMPVYFSMILTVVAGHHRYRLLRPT